MQSSKNELVGGLRSKGSFLALFDTVASKLKKKKTSVFFSFCWAIFVSWKNLQTFLIKL